MTDNIQWKRISGPVEIKWTMKQESRDTTFSKILGKGGPFSVTIKKKYSFDYYYNLSLREWFFFRWIKIKYKWHRFKTRNEVDIL